MIIARRDRNVNPPRKIRDCPADITDAWPSAGSTTPKMNAGEFFHWLDTGDTPAMREPWAKRVAS